MTTVCAILLSLFVHAEHKPQEPQGLLDCKFVGSTYRCTK